jgi:polyisoprenoid-binding protein YceI
MRNVLRSAVGVLALALVLPVSARAETWVIDPAHTVSGFTVKHMMIANVTGVFELTRGTIEYRPGDPGSVKADITIEAKSVNTRIGRRDDDLRSDNFFSAGFPPWRSGPSGSRTCGRRASTWWVT